MLPLADWNRSAYLAVYPPVRLLISTAIVAVVAVGCTRGVSNPLSSARLAQPAAANGTTVQQVRFKFFGSPAPATAHCPTPSRAEGAYTVLIGPTTGRPGSKVILSENTPLFNEAGHYTGPSGRIGFWFNLPFDQWEKLYASDGPPASANGVPVVHLGEASVSDQCSYRVSFRVPNVPAGTYGIVAIEHGGGGSAALGKPIEFRVTG